MEPSALSLLPPLLAIGCALYFRHVVLALFLGIFSGALMLSHGNPLAALLRTVDTYAVPAIADIDHATIIVFSLCLGGLVGVIAASGAMQGMVRLFSRWAHSARGSQLATFALGIVIFFDDYANTLLVGNTMRPLTDRYRVSREKLAFLVDSTAAPIAALTLSTWIGYEVGLIGDALKASAIAGTGMTVFITSIPMRFYPLLMIAFVSYLCWSGRDFGPMYTAEHRAHTTGQLLPEGAEPAVDLAELGETPNTPAGWWHAVVPIGVVIAATIAGLCMTGHAPGRSFLDVLNNAASGQSLLWGSLLGSIVAIVMVATQRILKVHEALEAWIRGAKSMLLAMVILVLAWSIGAVTKDVKTAEYLIGLLGTSLTPEWMALWTFLLASVTSFATGTSWGTMAILLPIIVPLFTGAALAAGIDPATSPHFLTTVSAVLAGAIFGDHCSPISDTTVLSSMASACDHIDHTRTQLPYALLVAGVSIVCGYIPIALGMHPWLSLGLGICVTCGLLRVLGKTTRSSSAPSALQSAS